jgi:hypothetical protein
MHKAAPGSTCVIRTPAGPSGVRQWLPETIRRHPSTPARLASATVSVDAQTVVDRPTRHADETAADQPPSGAFRGGSTTVYV